MNGQDRHRSDGLEGYTLVELLVVIAIILLISGTVVPTMIKSGFFSNDRSAVAARDLFAQLRAASVHAKTKNVNAAIAYDVEAPKDSMFTGEWSTSTNGLVSQVPGAYYNDSVTPVADPDGGPDGPAGALYTGVADPNYNAYRPVLTESIFVRQLTIEELGILDSTGVSLAEVIMALGVNDEYETYQQIRDNPPFVPTNSTFGKFQTLPAETCLLTNDPTIFEQTGDDVEDRNTFKEQTGLQSIAIVQVSTDYDGVYDVYRLLPKGANQQNYRDGVEPADRRLPDKDHWDYKFPAHVFKKTGGLDSPDQAIQRYTLSLGLRPDADIYDRFLIDEDTDDIIMKGEHFASYDEPTDSNYSLYYDLVGLETSINIYVPTGRVKVADDET